MGFGQSSNNITFSSWQKEDGLPNNHINAISKDKLGFLWIATDEGLCRYDGPNLIKVYKSAEDGASASNSLKSNNIRTLLCDSKGYIWIGTRFGGLTRFHPPTNEWKTFQHDPQQENSLSNDEVLTILEDSKQRIWVGTENGLNLFNPSTSTFTRFRLKNKDNNQLSGKAILTVMEDQQGWIWAGVWAGGLHLMLEDEAGQYNSDQIRYFQVTEDKSANNVWVLLHDKAGRYWIGTHGGGVLLMNLPANASNQLEQQNWQPTFRRYATAENDGVSIKSNIVLDIIQDQFENIWTGTAHGLHRLNYDFLPGLDDAATDTHIECFLPTPNDRTTLIGDNITTLYEDNQGIIWIGTSDGLSQYNLYSNQFKNFDFPDHQYQIAYESSFIVDVNENIWIFVDELNLIKYQLKHGTLKRIDDDINSLILGKKIGTFYSQDRRWMYVGTELGITAIDLITRKTTKYPLPLWVQSNNRNLLIKTIFVAEDSAIWFGTNVGLYKIDAKTKDYSLYVPESGNPNSISDLSVNQITQDSEGAIWIATYKGLNKITNPSAKEPVFKRFLFDAEHPEKGPLNNRIMCLKEFDGYLYIGTTSGLCRYNFSTNKFEAFNSLIHKYWIHSIQEGVNNDIWVSGTEGILRFDTQQESFRFFDKKDGLKNTSYRHGAGFRDDDNNIYFAHSTGFTYFSPETLASNETPPPVYITEIETMNRNGTKITESIYKDQIELSHNDYRLSVNFAALNYNRADKNQYIYRLTGFEEQWHEATFGVPIVYTNLKPQKYSLEVRAANNDGVWNEKGDTITIIQHPPYWETWWFRLLAIVLTGMTILLIFRWYTNNIRKRNEALQVYNKTLNDEIAHRKKVEQQLNDYNNELKRSNKDLEQFAYVSSHDLKEPLRVIGNFSGLLKRRYANKLDDDAQEYIGFIEDGIRRMFNVIESLLTYSTVGQKDSVYDTVNLNKLLKGKLSDLSQFIKDNNAIVRIGELSEIVGQEEQIGMVFYNLIHNAIKFNAQEEVLVLVQQEEGDEDYWKFSVKDNGIGIEPVYQEKIFDIFKRLHGKKDYEGTGIGLAVCQKIILRHEGRIWLESAVGKGTTFYFTVKKQLLSQVGMDLKKIHSDKV